MEITHTDYKIRRRREPEKIALIALGMTLSATTNATVPGLTMRAFQRASAGYDATDAPYGTDSLTVFALEQRKRQLKQRLLKVTGVHLPDDVLLSLMQTADLLAQRAIEPDYVLPTEDNGLSIEFRRNGVYHLIEFLPTGEIVLLKKQGKQIDTWDLTAGDYLDTLQNQLA